MVNIVLSWVVEYEKVYEVEFKSYSQWWTAIILLALILEDQKTFIGLGWYVWLLKLVVI